MIKARLLSIISRLHDLDPTVEHCGIIGKDGKVVEMPNQHLSPARNFKIDSKLLLPFLKSDIIIWHTHTADCFNELTSMDIHTAKLFNKPMLMVKPDSSDYDFFNPTIKQPFDGRAWKYYHNNCYTLLQDFYEHQFNLKLPDYYLDYPSQFNSKDRSKFLMFATQAGFIRIPHNERELRVGDVLVTNEGRASGWHCSVLVKTYPYLYCLSNWIDRPSGYFTYRAIKHKINSVWRNKNVKTNES